MLAVALPAADVREELGDNLWLALINSPKDCVVGGAALDIEHLRQKLSPKGVQSKLLDVSNAFHTPMMKEASMAVVDALSVEPPLLETARVPITSNVTGRWLHDEMCDPRYWGDHLCQTVQWSSNMQCLLAWEPDLVIEVGPGSTLSTLLERTLTEHQGLKCFRSMRSPNSSANDNDMFVDLLGDLWNEGCALDFEPLYPSKRRTVLPTYSFQKASFWVNPRNSVYVSPTTLPKVADSVNAAGPDDAAVLVPISSPENGVGDVTYRMYCFAFAGGSWRSFEDWQSEGLDLHVIAVDSQGTGYTAESTITSIANLICEDSGPTDRIIFCGFSFGALRAVEVFKKLPSYVQNRVVLMCAAGRSPPHYEARHVTLSNLDIDSCSLAPPEVRESELWKSFFLPRLMRDLQEDADAYNRICSSLSDNLWERMDCEVMVCCGTSDPTFHPSDAYHWASITSGPTSVELFPGDHSFLVEQSRQIFKRICKKVAGSLAPVDEVPFSYSIEWQRLTSKQERPDHLPEISFRYTSVSDSMIDLPADMEERLSSSEDHLLFVLVVGKGNPEKQAWSVIDLMKKIVGGNSSGTLEVIMVCRGTADGALVAGASKSISFEFPRISCRRVFIHDDALSPFVSEMDLAIAPQTFSREAPAWVQKVTKLCLQSDESDLWLKAAKNGRFRVYAPRLRSLKSDCSLLAQNVDKLGHRRPGDFILISGGSGGIGSILVKWLISEQSVSPDKIVVLSRRRIASANGERVVVIGPADNLLQCQDLVDLGDVAAIFHLAGVVDDAIVPNITLECFQRVKQPKADLVSALMDLVTELGWEPEFLCNFSSTSSLFGFPGQTSYCAANSYLDGQAAAADADFQSPCPVITVNWGPWAEAGLSKVGSKAYQTALEAGDRPLTNREALLAFSHVIRSHDSHQFAVCNTDWGKSIWRDSPLLRDIVSTRRDLHVSGFSGQSTPTSVIPDTTLWSSSFEDIIESFLKCHVSSWLPDETLVALGVDSLDMVRMSNAFERKFGRAAPLSTFVQRGLTLRALARDLRNVLV
jgi:surfactin synthase thioesterase subunit/acyl carrier protein